MAESETRRRMVEAAALLFQRHGYRGTSWRTLVRASATPWGSIQHHFPGGKEQLGVAAVAYGADLVGRFIAACFDDARSPAEGVQTWFNAAGNLLAASGYQNGCAVAAVALESTAATTALRDACAAAFESWTNIVTQKLRDAGVPEARAASLAVTLLAGFEGALLLARSRGDAAPLRQTGEHLAALLPASPPRARKPRARANDRSGARRRPRS